jgi:hypothetical protein
MTFRRNLLLAGAASSIALLVAAPASAHTVCRADGICFNTSGAPIAPWQQPAFRGGYAYPNGYYGYYHPYHHRYWRHYYRY